MWNIKIENRVKREKKMEENMKKEYEMIFEEFCPSQMQNRIKDHPKYGIVINDPLDLMDTID